MTRVASLMLLCILCFGCAGQAPKKSLYNELGGESGVAAIVNELIVEIASDGRIRHHFTGIHIAGFRQRLRGHFCAVTGGPCVLGERDMHEAHLHLGVRSADFNALVEDLMAAMDRLEIPYSTQNRFLALLAPMQRQIVNPQNASSGG